MKFNTNRVVPVWKKTGISTGFNGDQAPPIEPDETYEVKIERLGWNGDGIARINGYVIFIPSTKVGDRVKVRVNDIKRNFAFAKVVKIILLIAIYLTVSNHFLTKFEEEV